LLLVYIQTVKEFLQLLRSPFDIFDIGRSAVHKAVSAFMHNWWYHTDLHSKSHN